MRQDLPDDPALLGEGEDLWAICESCQTVLIYRHDGTFGHRAATDEERAAIPPKVVWSDEQRAEWQESLRQSKTDLRAWILAGCPGLTPEIERDMLPGFLDRIKRFVGLPDDDEGAPETHTEPL
jgi:hypothetical protein